MIPIICFTSDFGLEDAWVGVCHATIYRTCPQARVVNMGHQIEPFDIWKGAVVAASGVWQLPKAIHLVVVDPGVGGGRKDLCIVTGDGSRLIGPDNGVLELSTWRSGGVAEAYAIDPSVLRPRPPLPTFHARDVLAPAAATLASGVEPDALGPRLAPEELVAGPFERPRAEADAIFAHVLDVDRFGSVRLSIPPDMIEERFEAGSAVKVEVGHTVLSVPFGSTFSDVDPGEAVALIDSSGWLTLAVREGNAAERHGIEPRTPVVVRRD